MQTEQLPLHTTACTPGLVRSSASPGYPHCNIQVPGKPTGNGLTPGLFDFILFSLHLIFRSSSTIPSLSLMCSSPSSTTRRKNPKVAS